MCRKFVVQRTSIVVLLFLTSLAIPQSTTSTSVPSCRIDILPARRKIPAGDPLVLEIRTRSINGGKVRVYQPFSDVRLTVTRNGQEVPQTLYADYAKRRAANLDGSVEGGIIEGTSVVTEKIMVSRLFDFSLSGSYQITAAKQVIDLTGLGTRRIRVESDPITIDVVDTEGN
jgi:hypothetical protein